MGSASSTSISRERFEGYARALTLAGLEVDPSYAVACMPSLDAAASLTHVLLDLPKAPTALVCFNDVVAFGATLGIYQRGREPGRDVSVIGFDDIPWSRSWRPALTSMAIGPRQIGVAAGSLMQRRLENPDAPPQARISEAVLVERASTGPLLS